MVSEFLLLQGYWRLSCIWVGQRYQRIEGDLHSAVYASQAADAEVYVYIKSTHSPSIHDVEGHDGNSVEIPSNLNDR